jgi:hypothetical protein
MHVPQVLSITLIALVAVSSAVVVKMPRSHLSEARGQVSELPYTEEYMMRKEPSNVFHVEDRPVNANVNTNGFLNEDLAESDSLVVLGGDVEAEDGSIHEAGHDIANESSVQGDVEVNDELLQVLAEEESKNDGNEKK